MNFEDRRKLSNIGNPIIRLLAKFITCRRNSGWYQLAIKLKHPKLVLGKRCEENCFLSLLRSTMQHRTKSIQKYDISIKTTPGQWSSVPSPNIQFLYYYIISMVQLLIKKYLDCVIVFFLFLPFFLSLFLSFLFFPSSLLVFLFIHFFREVINQKSHWGVSNVARWEISRVTFSWR